MEFGSMRYGPHIHMFDTNDYANGQSASEYARLEDHHDCVESCEQNCGEEAWRVALCSRVGRTALIVMTLLLLYLILASIGSNDGVDGGTTMDGTMQSAHLDAGVAAKPVVNVSRATEVLTALCNAYQRDEVSGDSCSRLCYTRNWVITDYYENNKVVVVIKDGGESAVFKSLLPFIGEFDEAPDVSDDDLSNRVVDVVNEQLMLGWPKHYRRHLMETVWPTLLRTKGRAMTLADKRSLWALLAQPEFVLFRVLPLTRVTPKIIGTCGHMYQTESLVAFKMKGFYTNLKAKILVHVMGTMKLLYEFLDEPLQWCDVRFDNLGLSADYPKRFLLMDGDMVYTKSRLNALFASKTCMSDDDCKIGNCEARCTAELKCSERKNENLEVFCEKLVSVLYPTVWSKNNKYLVACNDKSRNMTQRLNELRLAWSWNLPDV